MATDSAIKNTPQFILPVCTIGDLGPFMEKKHPLLGVHSP